MDYWEYRKLHIPEVYKGKMEDSLQDGNFGEVTMLLDYLEGYHSDSPYFNKQKNIIAIYSLLNHKGFAEAVHNAKPFDEIEPLEVNDDDDTPAFLNKEVLKETLHKRLQTESEKDHTESAKFIKEIIGMFYPE